MRYSNVKITFSCTGHAQQPERRLTRRRSTHQLGAAVFLVLQRGDMHDDRRLCSLLQGSGQQVAVSNEDL